MKKKSSLFIISFTLVLTAIGCNTSKQKHNKRVTASIESAEALNNRFDDAFAETLTQKFNGSNLINKVSATDPNSNPLSEMLLNNGIKSALAVEFSMADDYNKVSEKTYSDCLELRKTDPDAECVNIMDTDIYKRSMAVWMYSDYAKGQAKKAFERLIEISENAEDSELINKISLKTGSGASQVSGFAKTFKANFENGLKDNVEKGFAHVSDKKGRVEFRRGAMNTLDYAAQAEMATIINEIHEENGSDKKIDVNLESLYQINRRSYSEEAKTGDVQPEELEAFNEVIKMLSPTKQQREVAAIGWHDVHGRTFQRGEYSLTYDDGPNSSTTNKLLDYLGSRSVESALGYKPHATFFVQARSAQYKSNRGIVANAKRAGHSIASHSYSHEDFSYFVRGGQVQWSSRNKNGERISLQEQLVDAKAIIENLIGSPVNYFRLPYASGRNTRALQNEINNNNLVHIFWNVNADDWRWRSVSPNSITRNYIREIDKAGRGVILLHDIHEYTVGPLTQALIGHFAANRNSIKIVPLEEGITETFINITANDRIPSNIVKSAPAQTSEPRRSNTAATANVFPHLRQITIGSLNVRTGPSSSYPVCGTVSRGDKVKIIGQSSWFILDTSYSAPNPLSNERRHRCGAQAYFSSGSNYSVMTN
jgi:peptidoglycan/xylan/chitin deacetylase (PgdA/CDA1 family)